MQKGLKQEDHQFRYAFYARKSTDEPDSRSIKNQLEVLGREIKKIAAQDKQHDYHCVGRFIDEDYTGTDSQRPDFKRLLQLIHTKEINMLMVTDLSRLSRNISESIYYVQVLFITLDIRFFSYQLPALDSYLEPEKIYSIEIPMQSMMNENHCAETSMKVRRSFDAMRSDGKFIGAFAGFGWKKADTDKHKLELDVEAFEILQEIKTLLFTGQSCGEIATILNEKRIPNPTAYKQSKGLKFSSSAIDPSQLWSRESIRYLLKRPENTGNLIQGRYRKKSYKVHEQKKVPQSEWFICEHRIPSIFTKEEQDKIDFCLALNKRVKQQHKKRENIYAGFLKCGDCKKAMNSKGLKTPEKTYYICNTYKNHGKLACSSHTIREDQLTEAIQTTIQSIISQTVDIKKIMAAALQQSTNAEETMLLKKNIKKQQKELEKINNYKKNLYQDWKDAYLDEQEYLDMKASYTAQEEQIQASLSQLHDELQEVMLHKEKKQRLSQLEQHCNALQVSRDLLCELINVIYVYEDKKLSIAFKCKDPYQKDIAKRTT